MKLKKMIQKAKRFVVRQGLTVNLFCVDSDAVRGRFALYSNHGLIGMIVIDTLNHKGIYKLLSLEEMKPQEAAE